MARRKDQSTTARNPNQIWQEFVQVELKNGSKLGKALETAKFGGLDSNTPGGQTLSLYFADDQQRKRAQSLVDKIRNKLSSNFRLGCQRIQFITGDVPVQVQLEADADSGEYHVTENPLQALYWVQPVLPVEEDAQPRLQILKSAVAAEEGCAPIYAILNERTKELAGDSANILAIKFDWRLRVGGNRGFRDLLLPVLHPVFGIPYIPASSIKGITRAWAERDDNTKAAECERLLGTLENGLGQVEFLDAFPTSACLSIDVATPQWHWQTGQHPQTGQEEQYFEYRPDPHPLVSLAAPEFVIGLRPTQLGNQDHVQIVKQWLQSALHQGVGSRVSSGYGYPQRSEEENTSADQTSIPFKLWTEGLYGSNPPAKANKYQGTSEFRPTALRGTIRYWFRAVALALYSPEVCKAHEEELFGTLGQQGLVSIRATAKTIRAEKPYAYSGQIQIIAQDKRITQLVQQLLALSSCLGGLGHGSRRPLHQVNRYWRGCHWELSLPEMPLPRDKKNWQTLINSVRQLMQTWKPSHRSYVSFPGSPGARRQDALDDNAQVWLLSSPQSLGKQPSQVDWAKEASSAAVRGAGLNLLYGDPKFKGKSQGNPGNPRVGGALQKTGNTPSYVWIKSVFPQASDPYQVITIFGANDPDRRAFADAVQKAGGLLVWG